MVSHADLAVVGDHTVREHEQLVAILDRDVDQIALAEFVDRVDHHRPRVLHLHRGVDLGHRIDRAQPDWPGQQRLTVRQRARLDLPRIG